jgi:prepilin-type N-terminal cleavage/methylation domain-containing protein
MRRGSNKGQAGFSLLEMMVAIAVLAVAMTAIMSAQQASMNATVMIKRGQTAALLMRSIIFDIEEEYRVEGFPENSLEDRDCEVPDDFDKIYECSYSLERFDLEPEQIQALVDQSFGGLMGEGGLGTLQSGSRDGLSTTMEGLVGGQTEMGGMDLTGLAFLMPFLGPEGEALMSLCNINLGAMLMSFMGVQSFMPQVLQEVSNRTRKLSVTLSWSEGPFGQRDFTITTYITSLPEEQLQQLKEVEDAQEVLEGAGVLPGADGSRGGLEGLGGSGILPGAGGGRSTGGGR